MPIKFTFRNDETSKTLRSSSTQALDAFDRLFCREDLTAFFDHAADLFVVEYSDGRTDTYTLIKKESY